MVPGIDVLAAVRRGMTWALLRLFANTGADAMSERATTRFFGLTLGLMIVTLLVLNAFAYN
jgi:tetrahydromethanopterin S-methyltransferase subunit B